MDSGQDDSNQKCGAYTMIIFKRYPHVHNLIIHYANSLQDNQIIGIMSSDITNAAEATALANLSGEWLIKWPLITRPVQWS